MPRVPMRFSKSKHNLPVRERFERFFEMAAETECWIWLGQRDSKQYGRFQVGNSNVRSHRVSYTIYKGPIPKGGHVLHACDNASCVNPAHLSVGTNHENQSQAWERDRKQRVRKLDPEDVLAIRASHLTQRSLAARYGVNQSEISRIKTGKRGVGLMLVAPSGSHSQGV